VNNTVVLAASVQTDVVYYVVLFLLVVLGGAGVPMIGTSAVTAAAILASQGTLSIDEVIGVACVAAIVGGVLGYCVGRRWGFELMQRPGRGEERRGKMLDQGNALYVKWGWLACFFIPSFIAGIARMRFRVFLTFNTIAAVIYQFATALPAYGAASLISGHTETSNVLDLSVGVVLVVLIFWRVVLPRRRSRTRARGDGGDEHPRGRAESDEAAVTDRVRGPQRPRGLS
jgi:membrane protein DedA with SNARE-associated domain